MRFQPICFFLIFTLILGVVTTSCYGKNHQSSIPINSFIQWSAIRSASISPDGKTVAVLRNSGSATSTLFVDVQTDKVRIGHLTNYMTRDLWLRWVDNNTVLVQQSIPPEGLRLIKYEFDLNKTTELLTTYADGNIEYIGLSADGKTLYVSGENIQEYQRSHSYNSVYAVDLASGKIEQLFQNRWDIDSWYTDHSAKRWLGYKYEDKMNYIYSFSKDAKQGKVIIEQGLHKNPDFIPLTVDSETNSAIMLTSMNSNTNGLYRFDLDSGKMTAHIHSDVEYDMNGSFLSSKDGSKVLAIHYQRDKGHTVFFDQKLKAAHKAISELFPQDVINVISFSHNRQQIVFYAYADTNPGAYYVYDVPRKKTKLIGHRMYNLPREKLASLMPIKFAARDDYIVQGYLSLPHSVSKDRPAPLIVMPHGGPYARDYWHYQHYLQFLVNRGYAVLQINFRSSTGYGLKHFEAGIKQYGATPINDVIDGVRWSLANYPIQPDKVCAFGASYGGYATLKLLTMEPTLFDCGIVMSGFGDLAKMLEDDKDEDFYDFEVKMMGDPETEKDIVRQNSPIFDIAKIQAPVFVIHGKLDAIVKYHHATQIIDQLKTHEKVFETMLLPDEGHSFIKRRNQKNLYRKLDKFLSKYLK